MKRIDEKFFQNDKKSFQTIEDVLNENERVLWRGKPKKKAYLLNAFFKMFPFAFIWLLFDGAFIGAFLFAGSKGHIPAFAIVMLIAFFAIHLLPVWIWLANIITASKQHKNLEYAFTDKRIVIKSGVIGIDFKNIYYSDIQSVNLKVGIIDRILKVGDVYVKSASGADVLFDIDDPYFITQKLQTIVLDIKTDVQFPNALRPNENPGYQTTYTGDKPASVENNTANTAANDANNASGDESSEN
ncbi:MAG: PH domain-containing protein [Clostridia bacterium]|nr:PH domain-containing protein [Clostridia bacterium]